MTPNGEILPLSFLGHTLAEFAAALGTHPQAAKERYRLVMRETQGVERPLITRSQEDDGVIKFCLPVGTREGKTLETESVIIPMRNYAGKLWYTLCLSSQVGCRMGCTFCETARMGLLQNLSAAQIVAQRLEARRIMLARMPQDHPDRLRPDHKYFRDSIQNIVFMGMGEPLDNLDQVIQAIRVMNEPNGLDMPHAQITVSTVGRIDGIRKLAALNWPNLRLAISLNAATDKLRNELMPVNKGMPLAELQKALLEYPLPKKGRFLIEYVLIRGVNDSLADAQAVVDFCKSLPCTVNLIPYNPQRDAVFATPDEQTIGAFLFYLKERGIFTKRRITHGRDLMSACGQLGNPEMKRKRTGASGHEPTSIGP